MEKFCTSCGDLFVDHNELNVDPWGVCKECLPKARHTTRLRKQFLVRTINVIPIGYFAISERDLSFFLSIRTKLLAKTARFERQECLHLF